MAVCDWCQKEMTDDSVTTCAGNTVVEFPDGEKQPSIAYNGFLLNQPIEGYSPSDRCGDCNIARGGFHHPGCHAEQCPRCEEQLIGCNCLDDEEEDEDDAD